MNVRGHTTVRAPAPAAPAAVASVHIDRLVLHGLPLGHDAGAQVREALGRELERLLADAAVRGELGQGAALSLLRLDRVTLDAPADPRRLGRQLARELACGLVMPAGGGTRSGEDHHG